MTMVIIDNLEARILQLMKIIDDQTWQAFERLQVVEDANAKQALTILELRSELADAIEGIQWRDAEIAIWRRSNDSKSREHELLINAKHAESVKP